MIAKYDDGYKYQCELWAGSNFERYTGIEVNRALMQQNLADIDQCVAEGWLTAECKAFDNSTVVHWCKTRGLDRSAAHLLALGFPE